MGFGLSVRCEISPWGSGGVVRLGGYFSVTAPLGRVGEYLRCTILTLVLCSWVGFVFGWWLVVPRSGHAALKVAALALVRPPALVNPQPAPRRCALTGLLGPAGRALRGRPRRCARSGGRCASGPAARVRWAVPDVVSAPCAVFAVDRCSRKFASRRPWALPQLTRPNGTATERGSRSVPGTRCCWRYVGCQARPCRVGPRSVRAAGSEVP